MNRSSLVNGLTGSQSLDQAWSNTEAVIFAISLLACTTVQCCGLQHVLISLALRIIMFLGIQIWNSQHGSFSQLQLILSSPALRDRFGSPACLALHMPIHRFAVQKHFIFPSPVFDSPGPSSIRMRLQYSLPRSSFDHVQHQRRGQS